jgi:hypothetical protein
LKARKGEKQISILPGKTYDIRVSSPLTERAVKIMGSCFYYRYRSTWAEQRAVRKDPLWKDYPKYNVEPAKPKSLWD